MLSSDTNLADEQQVWQLLNDYADVSPVASAFPKPERSKEQKKPGKGFAVQGSQTRPYLQADSHSLEKIEETLAYCRGNKTQAAQMLGLSTRQLYYRLEKLKEEKANAEQA